MKLKYLIDQIAKWVITFGGIFIILSVIAIIVFIGAGAIPLLYGAKAYKHEQIPISFGGDGKTIMAMGQDELREVGYIIKEDGHVEFFTLSAYPGKKAGHLLVSQKLQGLDTEARITAASQTIVGNVVGLGTSNGKVIILNIIFTPQFEETKRIVVPKVEELEPLLMDEKRGAIRRLAVQKDDSNNLGIAACVGEKRLLFLKYSPEGIGEPEVQDLTARIDKPVTGLAINSDLSDLIAALQGGAFEYLDIKQPDSVEKVQTLRISGEKISSLGFLLGGESLVVGTESGQVSIYFKVRQNSGEWKYVRVREFEPHSAPVIAVAASPRNKGFLTADTIGHIKLHYSTTGKTLFDVEAQKGPVTALNFAPRANGCLTAGANGTIQEFAIQNPYPEATIKSLFGRVWYEGYPNPQFVWQSTGLTEAFESKLSLIPLMFGTFKGSFYAMIFSVPLAIMGALYLSQLAPAKFRLIVKPIVELMAAMPSVLVGFLAGLWLSPLIARDLAGALLTLPFIPALVILTMVLWIILVPRRVRERGRGGVELLILIGVVIVGVIISFWLGKHLENALFGGDFKQWLFNSWQIRYDSRNCLVVGFALGFAIIPIIFTISEDAMSNVPPSLISGSLALGASRWQTALHVVVPAAAPGLFAAVMLGLGRAVGETMIVLMATGNTPILDMSIFNGMRTMSACIAVEIPEAPQGDTLYRVLFLTGFLLFSFTFVINSASELIGRHLRKRYGRF
jgi:phosphate transport system permease protein